MASTIRIKKRASSGAAGAPSSLASSELAFNENASDKKLYYGYGDDGSAGASSIITVGGNGAFCDLTTAQTVAGVKTFSDNVVVTGNLTVNGTTTTVNSTTTTVDDPVFTIGGDSTPGSDDNKDRGIEFKWHNGSAAKVGFFGFDDSTGKFTFIPDATNSSEVFSGSAGTIVAALEGNADTATALATGRTIAMTGDVAWTSSSFDGSGNVTGAGTIQSGAVETGMIAADAITNAKIADDQIDSEHYVDGSIDTAHIANGQITTAKIASDAVTNAKIADDSIDSEHYVDGSIDTAHLAADAITGAKIADDAIDSEHYTDGSIDTAHLAADCVTAAKIADDVIDSEHIAAGAVDLEHMSSESVDEDNLKISNGGSDGQFLQKQSGNTGGLTWATPSSSVPTTITVADESSDTTCFPLFATAATGDLGPKSGSNLTFNSSTGLLTATQVDGLIDGGTF